MAKFQQYLKENDSEEYDDDFFDAVYDELSDVLNGKFKELVGVIAKANIAKMGHYNGEDVMKIVHELIKEVETEIKQRLKKNKKEIKQPK